MSNGKKNYILNTIRAKLGCCRRPKLSAVFSPTQWRHKPHSTYSAATWEATTLSSSSALDNVEAANVRAVQGFGRIGGESVAVEKYSDDPYLDFRRSMLQMILEREIYSSDDLKELLNCFLQLNSPYYHGIIVRAFTEILNGDCSSDSPSSESPNSHGMRVSGDF